MFRTLLPALVLSAYPVLATAEEQPLPVWCCPEQCSEADENAALLPRGDASGEFDLLLNGTRIPVMPEAFHGTSAERPMQYCVGYDAFGDRQIKCLFIPAIT